jgi:hypothetical protein
VGRAASLLSRERARALAALLVLLVAYEQWHSALPGLPFRWEVALLCGAIIPAFLAPVWLVLPLRRERWLLPVGLGFAVLATVCEILHLGILSNLSKLAATTALGFWFLQWFEAVSWVVLVACIIPFVDAFSVYRGPTKAITHSHFSVYEHMAFRFEVPGRHGPAMFGPPDLLFFALFVAAAARFGLRAGVTWIACVASYGVALIVANASSGGGVPALPFLSVGFLVANADLLWRQWREKRRSLAPK